MCRPSSRSRSRQRDDLRRDHRLAAGDHHVPRRMRPHFVQNLIERQIDALRLPRRVGRIAPGAAQIAAAGADEDRRHAHQRAFALNRIEQLSDLQCRPLRIPCAAAGRHRTAPHGRPSASGIVATEGQPEIEPQFAAPVARSPPCVSWSSGAWILSRVRPSTPALGRQVRHAFVGLDELRAAVRIARVIQRVHADEDVRAFQHLGPGQREREENGVARRHIGDRNAVRHLVRPSALSAPRCRR